MPRDDRFQVVGEHEQSNFIFDQEYLGIRRSAHLVVIHIAWSEGGRRVERKKALYKAIADGLLARLSLRGEDVFWLRSRRRTGLSATASRQMLSNRRMSTATQRPERVGEAG
jgi:Tautomerase enzyme